MAAVFALVLFALVSTVTSEEDTYETKFDGVDIDAVIQNERLLNNYVNCILDRGNCAPEAEELKKNLKEALSTDCVKCSAKQKEKGEKMIRYLYKKKNDVYKEVMEKYDPKGTYVHIHKKFIE